MCRFHFFADADTDADSYPTMIADADSYPTLIADADPHYFADADSIKL